MATSKREFVLASFLSSCLALVLLIVALATNFWITAYVESIETGDISMRGEVNYGLFSGFYKKLLTENSLFLLDISVVCDFGENACMWSCLDDSSMRKEELSAILNGNSSRIFECQAVFGSLAIKRDIMRRNLTKNRNDDGNGDSAPEREFMNAGLWLCTLITLILALVLAAVTALLTILNVASNPVVSAFAVQGLYFWNGAAAGMDLVCLILWGSQYGAILKENIALNETSDGTHETESAALGWSYWMVLVALILSAANIGLLFIRDYLLKKQPPTPKFNPEKEAADGTLFLY